MTRIKYTTIFSVLLGTILEWYDFSLIGSLAPIISPLFFPSESKTLSLLAMFAVFATGFIARPVGAIIFGHIGDRHGRKNALSWSIILMGLPTTLIALLPTYNTIGVLAPVSLIVLRLFQGFSSSGEYPGAMCYLTESAPENRKGFFGNLSMLGVVGGVFLGSLMSALLSLFLSDGQIHSWGWRIPFLCGIPLSILGWFLRYKTPETDIFKSIKNCTNKIPLKEILQTNSKNLLKIIMFFSLSSISFYTGFVYITSYFVSAKKISFHQSLTVNAISTVTLALLMPLCGYISDKVDKRRMMLVGTTSLLVFFYPIFLLFSRGNVMGLLLGQLSLALLLAIFAGSLPAITSETFSAQTRYTGISLGINIGTTIFGGTCPLVATYLVERFGSQNAPGIYPIFFAGICLIILLSSKATMRNKN